MLIFLKGRGSFMEIGSYDGEFMSMSLWLEQVRKYRGLLVEPNPISYKKLRLRRRASFSINACATNDQLMKQVCVVS